MSSFSTGLSALTVSQRLIDLTGHNIANAGTPGYHRQVAHLAGRYFGGEIGQGVELQKIRRITSPVVETALLANTTETEALSTRGGYLQQIQSLLAPTEGSLEERLDAFFNEIERASIHPENLTQRQAAVQAAVAFTQELNSLAASLDQIQSSLDFQAEQIVQQVNALAEQIAGLNQQIRRIEASGGQANDLRDQRGTLINELASRMNLRVVEQDKGSVTVLGAGAPLVAGSSAFALKYDVNSQGIADLVSAEDPALRFDVKGGSLGGLLEVRNDDLPFLQEHLDELARTVALQVNEVHATGVGLNGFATIFTGLGRVTDPSVPLAQAGLSSTLQSGSLFLSVTHFASGDRTLHEIVVDPSTQSLQDVASAINAIPNVQGVIDSQTNTLTLLAAPGHGIDFAPRLPNVVDASGVAGTTVPSLGGRFTGTTNDQFTFTVSGSGTVGVTPSLTLEVRNSAGSLLDTLNVGQGYEPGSALQTVDGISVSLTPGTAQNGDTFSMEVVADSDTAHLLNALGIGTFFDGNRASNLRVRSEFLKDPGKLAGSLTGQVGDSSNFLRLAALRDAPVLSEDSQTFRQFHLGLIGDLGNSIQSLTQEQSASQAIGDSLFAQQQAVSGVDNNEELVQLLKFQRAFQISAEYLSVVNETLGELVNIIR